jgi:phage tail sheath gpL-like
VYLYVAGKLYAVPVNKSDTAVLLGNRIAATLSADESCPVSAGNVDGVVTLTAKSKGVWGNSISVAVNQRPAENQALPLGVTLIVSPMANGQGNPDVEKDLKNGLGSGDSANEEGFTAIVHGYGKDTVILDAISEYNGIGNENAGLYQETIARPFRSLIGDTGTGSAGLASLIAFTNLRTLDRTSGVIPRPGSLTHPAEIAAEAIGYMEMVNAGKAEAGYNEAPLSGVDPGYVARAAGQDWTTEYTNRDLAVHSGIGPTVVKGGTVLLTNVVSFYRPGNIPEKNRAFRRMRDISIIQNIQATYKQIFGSAKWTNFTVVEDVANVTNTASRALARDTGVVKDDLLSMIEAFMSRAWIYSTKPSMAFLKTALSVQVRDGGTGFNTRVPYVLSGEGNILDNTVELDASFAVMAQLG